MNMEKKKEIAMKTKEWCNLVETMADKHREFTNYLYDLKHTMNESEFEYGDKEFLSECKKRIFEARFYHDENSLRIYHYKDYIGHGFDELYKLAGDQTKIDACMGFDKLIDSIDKGL